MTQSNLPLPPSPAASTVSSAGGTAPAPVAVSTMTVTPPVPAPKIGGSLHGWTTDSGPIYFVGGEPKADWSGPKVPMPAPQNPNQVRTIGSSSEAKAWNVRTTPIGKKLKAEGNDATDVLLFRRDLSDHLKKFGMEPTLYVPSIMDPNQMTFAVMDSNQLTVEHVASQSNALRASKWDYFNTQDDAAAKELILASVDTALKEKIALVQMEDDTAATTFMRIMTAALDGSINRYNRIKDRLKALSLQQEAGENVEVYSRKARTYIQELVNGGAFEWTLLLAVVRAFAKCTVAAFSAYFNTQILPLDKQIQTITFLPPHIAEQAMVNAKMHWRDYIAYAEQSYKSLKENKEWGPANMPRDRNGAPDAHANLANLTEAQINSLVQSRSDKIINAKMKALKDGGSGDDKDKKNKQKRGAGAGKSAWRKVAPASGQPTTKELHGKTWNWCTKCNRGQGFWQHSHSTETHDPTKSTKKNRNNNNQQANLGETNSSPGSDDGDGPEWTIG